MTLIAAPAQAQRADPIHRQQCLDQAARCRRLAHSISDREASTTLLAMAEDYERSAWRRGELRLTSLRARRTT